MSEDVSFAAVPAGLEPALRAKGFTELTPVQQAVLAPELAGRDLRISSQTGSGKTVALGFAVAPALDGIEARPRRGPVARPRVLVIAPTRELAQQIARELTWLYSPLRAQVAAVTGGTNLGRDFQALGDQPHVLVGTPGRLVDHLERGSLDLSELGAVVLDEADEMLDMGFRDDLARILDGAPDDRRTHMVSATLPREVLELADRYQRDAARVQATRAGAANADIAHVGHVVRPADRVPALINLLLIEPDRRTLVFVRTRNAATEVAAELASNGFSAGALSGEMGQRERNAMLDAFRRNAVRVVVATDVAARGLDIEDVAQVIHLDLPENPEVLTHRSGRTGRAGNKGTSIALVPRSARARFEHHLRRAGIQMSWRPVPSADAVRAAADARLLAHVDGTRVDGERTRALAEALLRDRDPADVVAALLARSDHAGPCAPRRVDTPEAPPQQRPRSHAFTPFHVSWGASAGANPSRVLAMVCRRGGVRSQHIGAIQIGPHRSVVDVASHLADEFARAARRPDPRNPRIEIRAVSANRDRVVTRSVRGPRHS